jgi:hypothetical protein
VKIYEIDAEMLSLIDEETGEIADFERFEELQMERDKKVEHMIRWYKELTRTAEAINEEIKQLKVRKSSTINKASNLESYIVRVLNGAGFTSPTGEVRYRISRPVETDKEFIEWAKENAPQYLKAEYKPSLSAIGEAIDRGVEIPFARKVEKNNIQIR